MMTMCVASEFETFEKQFLELIQELQTISTSEHRLREVVRTEASRAEAAEASRDGALRAEREARSAAAANAASAAHAAAALAKVQDELAATKMQLELAERHRVVLEEKCSEMTVQLEECQREIEKLKPLQVVQSSFQRQYVELHERVQETTNEARREASRLEAELRRVEKSANGGAEIRDHARLAAAAHVRERRLAAAELQHTTHELHNARAEVTKLASQVAELQCRLSESSSSPKKQLVDSDQTPLVELKAALEAERTGAARLEQTLAAALADNAVLAAELHKLDNDDVPPPKSPQQAKSNDLSTNIGTIDAFLAE